MANESQARVAPERVISVDLSQADPKKAIERSAPRSDISAHVRDDDDRGSDRRGAPKRSKTEEELFKRMTRMQRSLTKNFDQKLASQQAEHQRELAALRQRYESGVEVERGGAAQLKDAHEKAMAELERQLADANEKGDSAGIARITAAMIKADGEYHAKLTGTQVRKDVTGEDPNRGGQQRQAPAAKGPTPAGSRFILANEDWWEDPDHEIEKAAASTIFLGLVQNEGFSDNDDETFKEVAKRLKEKFPDLPVMAARGKKVRASDRDRDDGARDERDDGPGDGDDDDEDEEGRDRDRDRDRNEGRGRAPAMRVTDRGAGNGRIQNGSRRTLTSEEIATMRKVGLNPESDKDVMSFMKEAVAMEQASR